jgi:capsular polysaccharide biosynthesis protein
MELSRYGRFLKRHLGLIIGTAVLVGLVAGGVSAMQKNHAEATASVLLKVKDNRQLADYDYDQFYVVQATDQYASNVVSWLNSAQVRDDIRRAASVSKGRITGKKNGGTIELTTTAAQSDQAAALARSATTLIAERTTQLSPGPSRSSFEASPTAPAVETVKPTPARDAAIGFVAGLVLGLVFALLAEAARPRETAGSRRRTRG